MREAEPAVEMRSLSFRYGRTKVLDGVSLTASAGQVFALLGRNGAGKSTAIGCLLGHLEPTDGQVRLAGRDPWRQRARLMRDVGVVPERPDAPPGVKVSTLISFYRRLYERWDEKLVADRLSDHGVSQTSQFGRLSRGQRTQVMLTLALASRPRTLILDDPTLGLDPVARRSVFDELIGELAESGTTVFLSTHDLAGVEGLADRVGILDGGRVLLEEDAESLRSRFRTLRFPQLDAEAVRRAVKDLRPLSVATGAWGTEAVVAGYRDEWAAAVADSAPPEIAAMTLEEIFVSATTSREVAE